MNRRSFFGWSLKGAISGVGLMWFGRVLQSTEAVAAPKVKGRAGGGSKAVFATDASLAGLPTSNGVSDASFWTQSDKIPTIQNFCDASIVGNVTCGTKRQPGQFCGSCTFLQERSNYQGNVAGKCPLIPPQPPKTHVHGNNYCASYAANPSYKYEIKS